MSSHPPAHLEGQGTHTIAIGEANGEVVLRFERPVDWVSLDSETARNVAEQIARSAYKARFGDTPTTQRKSAITDALSARMRLRVQKMLQSMEGQDLKIQSNAIVDMILTEIA